MAIIIDTPLRRISEKITPKYIGYGEVDVLYPDSYYLQDSPDGNFILDSNGHRILQGVHSPYILDSEGEITLDHDENPILENNWRLHIIRGVATPLDTLETTVQHVTIQAKFTNLGKIWVGGSSVQRFRGLYLSVGSEPVTINIDDLRKVYIIGNAGEGVTYLYGTREDLFLTSPDGSFITSPDGSLINV